MLYSLFNGYVRHVRQLVGGYLQLWKRFNLKRGKR